MLGKKDRDRAHRPLLLPATPHLEARQKSTRRRFHCSNDGRLADHASLSAPGLLSSSINLLLFQSLTSRSRQTSLPLQSSPSFSSTYSTSSMACTRNNQCFLSFSRTALGYSSSRISHGSTSFLPRINHSSASQATATRLSTSCTGDLENGSVFLL